MTTKTILIDTGSTYTVPSDFSSLVSIECIGAGGTGFVANSAARAGAGGGAYAKQTTDAGVTAGAVINIHIGVGGGTQGSKTVPGTADTWFDSATTVCYAQGAASAVSNISGAAGTAANCFPTSGAFSGGSSGAATNNGGGGAAGKNGAGGPNSGTTGGTGDNATGGAGGSSSTPGQAGTEWSYDVKNTTATPGTAGSGGGGSGTNATGATAGKYGGGGGGPTTGSPGAGQNGCIFLTYNVLNLTVFAPRKMFLRR